MIVTTCFLIALVTRFEPASWQSTVHRDQLSVQKAWTVKLPGNGLFHVAAFAPDGSRMVAMSWEDDADSGKAVSVDLSGEKPVVRQSGTGDSVVWSPNGPLVQHGSRVSPLGRPTVATYDVKKLGKGRLQWIDRSGRFGVFGMDNGGRLIDLRTMAFLPWSPKDIRRAYDVPEGLIIVSEDKDAIRSTLYDRQGKVLKRVGKGSIAAVSENGRYAIDDRTEDYPLNQFRVLDLKTNVETKCFKKSSMGGDRWFFRNAAVSNDGRIAIVQFGGQGDGSECRVYHVTTNTVLREYLQGDGQNQSADAGAWFVESRQTAYLLDWGGQLDAIRLVGKN